MQRIQIFSSLFEQERVLLQLRPEPLLEALHLALERQLPPQRLLRARLNVVIVNIKTSSIIQIVHQCYSNGCKTQLH